MRVLHADVLPVEQLPGAIGSCLCSMGGDVPGNSSVLYACLCRIRKAIFKKKVQSEQYLKKIDYTK
jgi:hypothetical protein